MLPLTIDDDPTTASTDLVVIDLLDTPARDLDGLAFMCRCRTAGTAIATAPASAAS